MNTPDASLAALLGLLSFVLSVALYVWTALAVSAMFRKMGEEPWKAWVPFLNTATLLKWGGFSPWLVLLSFIPVAQIVVYVLVVVSAHRINPGFGYGTGMTVLAALLFVVWASILGFGPARWLGARAAGRRVSVAPDPAPSAAPAAAPTAVAWAFAVPAPAPVGAPGDPGGVDAWGATGTPAAAAGPAAAAASVAGADASAPEPDGVAFAPPVTAPPASVWTPPDTSPRPASGVGAPAPDAAPFSGEAAAPGTGIPPAPAPAVPEPAPAAAPAPAVPAPAPAAVPAPAPAVPAPAATDADDEADDDENDADADASWPSEIDDVSAIYPSPFPPSPADGGPYAAPPVSGMGDFGGTTGSDARESSSSRPAAGEAAPAAPIAFVPGRRAGEVAPPQPAPVTRVPAARRAEPVDAPPSDERRAQEGAAQPAAEATGAGVAPVTPAAGALFAQPARARRTSDANDPDAFPELSGEVSAVVGSPSAGAPRSAVGAVSAQHRRSESGERERPEIDGQDRVDPPVRRTGAAPAAGPVTDDDPFADDVLDQTVIARRSVRPVWELVPASGSPVPLSASVVILGRRPSSDPAYPAAQLVAVPGDARTVSKTHARIELRGDAWTVTDLGSTNGVLVRTLMGDEVEVEAGGQLDAGERFFLGDEEFHLRRIAH